MLELRKDISGWSTIRNEERARRFRDEGLWTDRTIADYALEILAADPDRVLVVDRDRDFTVRRICEDARLLASALVRRGYRPGDRVSYQLPNWYETIVINLASAMAGLVVHPIVPIYRDHEVGFMLADSASHLIFIPSMFRKFDYMAMMRRLQPRFEQPIEVIVVRGEPGEFVSFEGLLSEGEGSEELPGSDPDAVKMIIYTSGTTGRAKGVLHSHNTLNAENLMRISHLGIAADDVLFNPSPVTHVTGILYSLCLPFTAGIKTVMLDVWEPAIAMDMLQHHRINGVVAATVFLQAAVEEAKKRSESLPDLRFWLCGGAQVSPDLVREAAQVFTNCIPSRVYGATEVPMISAGANARSMIEMAATTDGEIWMTEARIVDPQTGVEVGAGQEGEIVARGPQAFLGYVRQEDNYDAFTADGFFKMGDLGRIEDGRFVTITGRRKDVIIRAGENISPKEIEDILLNHPAIQDIAIVAMPHPRTGEAACAYVMLREGQTIDLSEILRYLVEAGTAMQKIPERLEIVDDFPRTSIGKVRKDLLREAICVKLEAEAG